MVLLWNNIYIIYIHRQPLCFVFGSLFLQYSMCRRPPKTTRSDIKRHPPFTLLVPCCPFPFAFFCCLCYVPVPRVAASSSFAVQTRCCRVSRGRNRLRTASPRPRRRWCVRCMYRAHNATVHSSTIPVVVLLRRCIHSQPTAVHTWYYCNVTIARRTCKEGPVR